MNSKIKRIKIKAHSKQQFDKCQDYLKGDIKLKDMFNLMTTYRYEIMNLVGVEQFHNDTDENLCELLCRNIYY